MARGMSFRTKTQLSASCCGLEVLRAAMLFPFRWHTNLVVIQSLS
jgi:hypothetical protein